ncbi:hypothetical protein Esti_000916 [Eimeria stiedai]
MSAASRNSCPLIVVRYLPRTNIVGARSRVAATTPLTACLPRSSSYEGDRLYNGAGLKNRISTEKKGRDMVTTRQRKASAAPPDEFTSRLGSGEATAGPFTLNKLDPKVSVSGARVDRQGLHVSLTIPLDSSVSSRTRTKTATLQRSSAALTQFPQGHTTPSTARRSSRSPKSKTVLAAANVATQISHEHDPKPKTPRGAAISPHNDRQSRSQAAPSTSPPVSAAADTAAHPSEGGGAPAGTSQDALRAGKKEGGKSRWLSRTHFFRARKPRTRSSTLKARSASSADSQNPSAPTIPHSVFETHTAQHPAQGDLVEADEAVKVQECKLSGLEAPSSPRSSYAGRSLPVPPHTHRASAAASQAGATVTNQLVTYGKGTSEREVAAETGGLALQPPPDDGPRPLSISVRTALAKFTTWPAILIALLASFWGWDALWSLCFPSALAPLRWTVNEAAAFLLSDETKEVARGNFYLLEDPGQFQCDTLSRSCPKGEESPCWFPAEYRLKGCVVLGEDVAAREAGGSIDYSLTTDAVPVKALRLSFLLYKVASFAMPRFPLIGPASFPASLDTSEGETATLRRSYFPLYNHDNDPGKLLADSSATYIITQTQGQVVVALPRETSVAAVAFDTPAALEPHGQCGPLEVRWFSVYVHLDGSLKATCPIALAAEKGLQARPHGGSAELTWCKVSTFEYRCSESASLQVFCLHAFPGSPEAGEEKVHKGMAACDFDRGWPTNLVKLLLENNWGAEATRIRRIRILAGSAQPLDRI